MNNLRDEFKDKKIEFEIDVPLDYETIGLILLNRINVDYPVPLIGVEGNPVPILGVAIADDAVLPVEQWTLEVDINTNYKIMQKKYNFKNYTVNLKLREE
jgi:hypothetical protein